VIGRRRQREQIARLRTVEWQTRQIALFIAQQAPVDIDKHGGRNPLVDAALQLSLIPDEEDEELAALRGEQTGTVTDEEGRKLMAARGKVRQPKPTGTPTTHAPMQDTIQVDEQGNVIGVSIGVDPEGFTEREFGEQATPGSFEAFMRMFGNGGAPGPR